MHIGHRILSIQQLYALTALNVHTLIVNACCRLADGHRGTKQHTAACLMRQMRCVFFMRLGFVFEAQRAASCHRGLTVDEASEIETNTLSACMFRHMSSSYTPSCSVTALDGSWTTALPRPSGVFIIHQISCRSKH